MSSYRSQQELYEKLAPVRRPGESDFAFRNRMRRWVTELDPWGKWLQRNLRKMPEIPVRKGCSLAELTEKVLRRSNVQRKN